ncbi:hypothetical protein B0J13DRAFT_211879 [Dactylonectria estremocensis]|uniref:Uncharacterized protein n=1 Tax=Dactylonectria estremocensis TaxID=1079267 RepID=A0A9P9J761_9HYPO|nr:hypothetical protein B0J13DRAFT_211879 [Dactylonectria estremocensis]
MLVGPPLVSSCRCRARAAACSSTSFLLCLLLACPVFLLPPENKKCCRPEKKRSHPHLPFPFLFPLLPLLSPSAIALFPPPPSCLHRPHSLQFINSTSFRHLGHHQITTIWSTWSRRVRRCRRTCLSPASAPGFRPLQPAQPPSSSPDATLVRLFRSGSSTTHPGPPPITHHPSPTAPLPFSGHSQPFRRSRPRSPPSTCPLYLVPDQGNCAALCTFPRY